MKSSRWKLLFGAAFVLVVATIFFLNYAGKAAGPHGSGLKYKEFAVIRGTFKQVVSASGVVRPIDRIEIKSKASGRIDELPIEEGDFVQKGSLICKLDPTDIQSDVDQARADLDIAEAELKQARNTFRRRSQLFEKNLISQEELDETDLALAQARGRMVRARTGLSQAELRLSETTVKSPIDGIILKKLVEAGQIIASGISNVSGGTAIVALADMERVHIEAGVDEIDVGKVVIGQWAVVVAEAYPHQTFFGHIKRISPEARVEQNVTLFDVVVEVENGEGKLKSGMNATVEITVIEKPDILLAPAMALQMPRRRDAGRFVRTTMVKDGGQFVSREVEIGLSDFRQTEIISGLTESDTVGVPMTSRLKDENDRMEQRIRSSRSFGAGNSK